MFIPIPSQKCAKSLDKKSANSVHFEKSATCLLRSTLHGANQDFLVSRMVIVNRKRASQPRARGGTGQRKSASSSRPRAGAAQGTKPRAGGRSSAHPMPRGADHPQLRPGSPRSPQPRPGSLSTPQPRPGGPRSPQPRPGSPSTPRSPQPRPGSSITPQPRPVSPNTPLPRSSWSARRRAIARGLRQIGQRIAEVCFPCCYRKPSSFQDLAFPLDEDKEVPSCTDEVPVDPTMEEELVAPSCEEEGVSDSVEETPHIQDEQHPSVEGELAPPIEDEVKPSSDEDVVPENEPQTLEETVGSYIRPAPPGGKAISLGGYWYTW